MTISQQTIAEVQSRVNIEEVVTDFITLKRKGQNLWACCPFHHEKTPSFSVAPTKGFYKCFGCGVSGDAITFVMEIEGISFPQAIKYLAKKYGIVIREEENEESHQQQQNEKDSLYILLDIAKEYYTNILWKQVVWENHKLRLRRRAMETELRKGKSSSLNHRAIALPYPSYDVAFKTHK